jgi:hypothetical protein
MNIHVPLRLTDVLSSLSGSVHAGTLKEAMVFDAILTGSFPVSGENPASEHAKNIMAEAIRLIKKKILT